MKRAKFAIFWSKPFYEAHQAHDLIKHAKQANFLKRAKHVKHVSTPSSRARKAREYAKHVKHAKQVSTQARHLADPICGWDCICGMDYMCACACKNSSSKTPTKFAWFNYINLLFKEEHVWYTKDKFSFKLNVVVMKLKIVRRNRPEGVL